jgi:hypothetical protein
LISFGTAENALVQKELEDFASKVRGRAHFIFETQMLETFDPHYKLN